MMRKAVIVIIVLALGVAFAMATVSLAKNSSPAEIGEEVPDFSLQTVNDGEMSLSNFRGKPTTLIFFSTWCPSCREQQPYMNQFEEQYNEEYNLVFINRRENKKMVQKFVDEFNVTSNIFLDPNDSQAKRFGVTGQPEAFFIDKQGTLLYHHIGPMTDEWLLTKWEELN